MNLFYKILLYVSLFCFGSTIALLILGYSAGVVGITVVLMLIALAIGVRGTDTVFKDFAFSIWVFASVAAAMFYPSYFTELGGFKLSALIVPRIQIIMFCMGTYLNIKDFVEVGSMHEGVIFGIM